MIHVRTEKPRSSFLDQLQLEESQMRLQADAASLSKPGTSDDSMSKAIPNLGGRVTKLGMSWNIAHIRICPPHWEKTRKTR